MDYKAQDRKSIIDYLSSVGGPVAVSDIAANSGADKLRVYPILFELQMEGIVRVIEAEQLGAPSVIELV